VPRIVADSNIYISALQFRGKPLELLQMAERGEIELLISDHIVEEVTRTLRERFEWPEARLQEVIETVTSFTKRIEPTQRLDVVKDDPDDNRILECAVEGQAECVVTGDKDLLRLRQHGAIRIVQVAEFLQTAQGKTGQAL
jgi:uncharacterized protein